MGAGLPEWKQLLKALAQRPEVPLDEEEVRQLMTLGLPDQAAVVASRLASASSASASSASASAARSSSEQQEWLKAAGLQAAEMQAAAAAAGGGGSNSRADGIGGGGGQFASLVVDELSSKRYSITHGLLAGLPVNAVVTTNYDALFETAWRAADKECVRANIESSLEHLLLR